jgi:hypothetical protein
MCAVGTGAPEGQPPGEGAQAPRSAVGHRDGGVPGEVLAVLTGTPERGPPDQPAQATGGRHGDGEGDLGRHRCGCQDGGRAQRRNGPQRDPAPGAVGAVGDRATRAVRLPGQHRVGAVEDVEQPGQRAVGIA